MPNTWGVTLTTGCFDMLHFGHVAFLQEIAKRADRLIVGINCDRRVTELKGPKRPAFTQEQRTAMLEALTCVDEVEVFDEDTPAELIERRRPDTFVKGGEWLPEAMPETAVCQRLGIRVVVIPSLVPVTSTACLRKASGD